MSFSDAILNRNNFSPIERELVILAVTSIYDMSFCLYAHTQIALNVGMTKAQIASASKGVEPSGLSDVERVVYATALELAGTRTPLKEETWQKAEAMLGKARCGILAHVVGLYLYTGSLLRMGAVSAPEND